MRRGALWAAGGTMIMRVSNVLVMVVVARLVAPEVVGLFAIAVTVHAFVVSIAELGIASAVARADLDADRIAPTVATIAIATSVGLGILMASFADVIAAALGAAAASDAVRILAISVAMIGPFAVPGALLQRQFRQDLVFRATAVSFVVGSAVLIGLSVAGWGPEGFAWSRVVGHLVAGIMLLIPASARYWPGFDRGFVGPLLAFGLPLAAANLLSQLVANIDYVFIGRMLGVVDLGLYTLAFGVSMWATAIIGAMLNGLVLPAISAVRRDDGDVPAAIVNATQLVAWVAFPLAACLFVFAEPLIVTLYGDQWREAAEVLRVLACYGGISVLGLLYANIVIAFGRTRVLLGVQLAVLAVLAPVMWIGITFWDLPGVAAAHIIVAALVTLPVYLTVLRHVSGVRLTAMLRALMLPSAAAIAAGLLAWAVTVTVQPEWLRLIIGLVVGAASYTFATRKILLRQLPTRWRRISLRRRRQ
ncbi:oligosaccharide flippase family protein [Diaminobutyricimonas sp. TR449]|uniref:oligosaccharide flippase family protein n=1 Tax=Diaminobutyricimonas sp. TR449 TaxID=2708076 RepID=UPI002443E553|nr:oligosaccharide flippase family protein [Diaminobutyricimonas sp. TR449]